MHVAPAIELPREARLDLEKQSRRRAHPDQMSVAAADWLACE